MSLDTIDMESVTPTIDVELHNKMAENFQIQKISEIECLSLYYIQRLRGTLQEGRNNIAASAEHVDLQHQVMLWL